MRELRRIRREKDVTQAELGRQIGLTAAGISALERGDSKASQDTLIDLADALGVTTDDLLSRTPKVEAEELLILFAQSVAETLNDTARRWSAMMSRGTITLQQFGREKETQQSNLRSLDYFGQAVEAAGISWRSRANKPIRRIVQPAFNNWHGQWIDLWEAYMATLDRDEVANRRAEYDDDLEELKGKWAV